MGLLMSSVNPEFLTFVKEMRIKLTFILKAIWIFIILILLIWNNALLRVLTMIFCFFGMKEGIELLIYILGSA